MIAPLLPLSWRGKLVSYRCSGVVCWWLKKCIIGEEETPRRSAPVTSMAPSAMAVPPNVGERWVEGLVCTVGRSFLLFAISRARFTGFITGYAVSVPRCCSARRGSMASSRIGRAGHSHSAQSVCHFVTSTFGVICRSRIRSEHVASSKGVAIHIRQYSWAIGSIQSFGHYEAREGRSMPTKLRLGKLQHDKHGPAKGRGLASIQ